MQSHAPQQFLHLVLSFSLICSPCDFNPHFFASVVAHFDYLEAAIRPGDTPPNSAVG